MNDLEDRIAGTLTGQVQNLHPPGDLAVRCLRRARTVRRRQATVLAAVAVAVGITVPAVLVGARAGSGPDQRPPVATIPATPAPPDPAAFRSWLGSLPQGEISPRLALEDPARPATFRYAGRDYRRPGPGLLSVRGATTRGLLAIWHSPGFTGAEDFDERLVLLQPDGAHTILVTGYLGTAGGAAVSADGARVAYAVTPATPGASATLTVVDVGTQQNRTQPTEPATSVAGWSGEQVVTVMSAQAPRTVLWTPDLTEHRTLTDAAAVTAGPGSDRLMYESPDGRCRTVISTAGTKVYSGCGTGKPAAISPDGRRVLLAGGQLRDLDTGAEQPFGTRLTGAGTPETGLWESTWEDDGHLLIILRDPLLPAGHAAAVRCDLAGRCERASPPNS